MSLNLKERYGLLINNEWVAASDGAEFNVYNPANGEQLAICAEATKDDVDKAVAVSYTHLDVYKRQDETCYKWSKETFCHDEEHCFRISTYQFIWQHVYVTDEAYCDSCHKG